ncbi:MAG TPA: type II toxin-antitoxin system PemK/MazF family toxin [Verrucomicrobiae bacterium]|jgi:mRNA interferase MazF
MANLLTRGKIVLVPFPFDDLSTSKLRPAVCLTELIGPNRHVIVAFITSREIYDLLPTDISIPKSHPDFSATGLRVNSVLRLHRLVTLSTSIIKRQMGRLSPDLEREMTEKLSLLFSQKSND